MRRPVHETKLTQPMMDSLPSCGTQLLFEFQKTNESLEIKDVNKRTVLIVNLLRDSLCCSRTELLDANDEMIATFENNYPSLTGGGVVTGSSGQRIFSMRNKHMFQKHTFIGVSKEKDLVPLSLDMALALKDVGLASEKIHLNDLNMALALRCASLCLTAEAEAKVVPGSLSAKSTRVAAEFVGSSFEEKEYQFKGSWKGKKCAMYIEDTETKIAQMHKLDDNNTEGFLVEIVVPDVNWVFVIACFEAMKTQEKRRKECLGPVVGIAANFVGGVAIGAGTCCFNAFTAWCSAGCS